MRFFLARGWMRLYHDVLVGSDSTAAVRAQEEVKVREVGEDTIWPVCTVAVLWQVAGDTTQQTARPKVPKLVTDSGLGAQSTGNRGMVSNKVGARLKLGAHS